MPTSNNAQLKGIEISRTIPTSSWEPFSSRIQTQSCISQPCDLLLALPFIFIQDETTLVVSDTQVGNVLGWFPRSHVVCPELQSQQQLIQDCLSTFMVTAEWIQSPFLGIFK